jgi:hypothetical protein
VESGDAGAGDREGIGDESDAHATATVFYRDWFDVGRVGAGDGVVAGSDATDRGALELVVSKRFEILKFEIRNWEIW